MNDDVKSLLNRFSSRPSRRAILQGLAAIGASAATLDPLARALAQASDEEVKSITVLTQGGPVVDVLREFAEPMFAKEVPDTAVELEVSSNSVTYPKMIATRDDPIVAGGMFNDLFSARGIVDKLWTPLEYENMPNAEAVPEEIRADDGFTKIFQQTPYGIMYNPDKVEKPTSWNDLYKPEYKGRVSMWASNFDAYAMAGVAAGKGFSVAAGIEAWVPHKQNIGAWVTSPVAEEDLVARGEMWLAPHWGAWAEQARASGKNVAFTIPEEGGTLWSNHACCVTGMSPKKTQLTQAYLNTWFAEEIQREWLSRTFISPAVGTVEIPEELLSNPAVVTPEEAAKLYRLPAAELASDFKRYNTMITRQLQS
ncbi:ABC transporter substrate-binding protein [Microbaculum marinum]|uniref:Extracellular solute-binding protein n=1 Tax=Microbaculum marinum TaxID=1764581 RepID=A0AAW9RI00_9HYPH